MTPATKKPVSTTIISVYKDHVTLAMTLDNLLNFSSHNKNINSQKTYREDYRNFKNRLKSPTTYLKKKQESKFLNHFLSRKDGT